MANASNSIALIGYACGHGAGKLGCNKAPLQLQQSPLLDTASNDFYWYDMLSAHCKEQGLKALPIITSLSKQLAAISYKLTKNKKFFVTIGGDHTAAIGTWSGTAAALAPKPLGLIWIDAHLDSHTFTTTPSGNIHGMPLATLLGYGDKALTTIANTKPKILPENVCVIGARSFEPEEHQLLIDLKVKIFYMADIHHRGLMTVFNDAAAIVSKNGADFGISLDLDAINPEQAPGVGTPEPNGINISELYEALSQLVLNRQFIAAEIVEFNPDLDVNGATEQIIANIIKLLTQKAKA